MIQKPDHMEEECGVFGVFGHPEASALVALGLHALQHRGQEATGIVSCDGHTFYHHRAPGLVGDAYGDKSLIQSLKGSIAIGHNRYATTGAASTSNIQPLFGDLPFGGFALAHNGNLTNALTLRRDLVQRGSLFQSTTDTEVIIHLMAIAKAGSAIDRMSEALTQITGAWSLVACTNDSLIGVRDPLGIRPLSLGRLGDAYILSSETCAFDIIGAEFVRDVAPGEIIRIDRHGLHSTTLQSPPPPRLCIFEYIYFARPDSVIDDRSVYAMRQDIGAQLAIESPCPGADIVVPVPDSGVPAALGYAKQSGLPFELGIIRNHYIGRTFIEPSDGIRQLGVKLKHNPNRSLLDGKSVVLVDDSIVRGTTSKKIVQMVRDAGAREVHMRISSPPITHGCFYGIDTPSTEDLMAHRYSVEEIAEKIGVDSLAYISVDGLYRAAGKPGRDAKAPGFCDACFTGEYPVALTDLDTEAAAQKTTSFVNGAARKAHR